MRQAPSGRSRRPGQHLAHEADGVTLGRRASAASGGTPAPKAMAARPSRPSSSPTGCRPPTPRPRARAPQGPDGSSTPCGRPARGASARLDPPTWRQRAPPTPLHAAEPPLPWRPAPFRRRRGASSFYIRIGRSRVDLPRRPPPTLAHLDAGDRPQSRDEVPRDARAASSRPPTVYATPRSPAATAGSRRSSRMAGA
jgi:hypothetical protein